MDQRLEPGTRLGGFEVLDLLGAGGMGEVYRARDTRLGRLVALKTLPASLAQQPARLARLRREARILAALSHPNVATLYGLEETDGIATLVMQLVQGRTLAQRLTLQPMNVREALELARQIAAGLEAAHERGILHRDLKPANIVIDDKGHAKLLDFGLATTSDEALADSHESTESAMTSDAHVAGTAPYMSPEQARGEGLDKRSDVWSFGCVLYELLTARRAFAGTSRAETMAAILDRQPDWSLLPEATPAGVLRLLRRCLEKDRERRLRDIGDARLELEDEITPQRPDRGGRPGALGTHPKRRLGRIVYGAIAVAVIVVTGLLTWKLTASREWPFAVGSLDSVAVLPFVNTTAAGAQEHVAAMVGDQIALDLGAIRSLRVVSGPATQAYRGLGKPADVIARELRVAALLQGSTLISGQQVRITVRLVEGSSQRQLWDATYEGDVANLFNLSKDITRAVLRQVRPTLTPLERDRLDRREVQVNPAVLEFVRAGSGFEGRTRGAHDRKRRYLERAIELDPSYAPAYAALAESYLAGLNNGTLGPPADMYAAAIKAADTAMRLDPESADAHSVACQLALIAEWNWQKAETHCRRAIAIQPNSVSAHNSMRHYLTVAGRYEEARFMLGRLRDLHPLNPVYPALLGWHYLSLRRYDLTIEELDREALKDPRVRVSNFWLLWRAVAFVLSGRPSEARETCDAVLRGDVVAPRAISVCGFVYGRMGDRTRAADMLDRLRERGREDEYVDPFLLATVEAGRGDRDQVFRHLVQAADDHSLLLIGLTTAPWFDAFHDDSRYTELVRRIGFPQHTKSQRVPSGPSGSK